MTVLLSVEEAHTLISNALTGSGTLHENAKYFTDAILDTELSDLGRTRILLASILL